MSTGGGAGGVHWADDRRLGIPVRRRAKRSRSRRRRRVVVRKRRRKRRSKKQDGKDDDRASACDLRLRCTLVAAAAPSSGSLLKLCQKSQAVPKESRRPRPPRVSRLSVRSNRRRRPQGLRGHQCEASRQSTSRLGLCLGAAWPSSQAEALWYRPGR